MFSTLRSWLKRRRMWANRTCWTWKRRRAEDPIVTAVKGWTKLPSMEKP
jgi:hypothetical protein